MKEILFVSAQPDVPYFIWQIKLYVNNFIDKGIDPNQIHVVLGLVLGKTEPSKGAKELVNLGINTHFFIDNRVKKHYIPSIKPYLISKWIQSNPDYGKIFFLHDADIMFRELPKFNRLLNDEVSYLSNTIGYIGYDYIMDCCKRYESKHPNSAKQICWRCCPHPTTQVADKSLVAQQTLRMPTAPDAVRSKCAPVG